MAQLQGLFTVPVLTEKWTYDYQKELEFIKSVPKKNSNNQEKRRLSDDTYILNRPELSLLHSFIKTNLDGYIKNVYGSDTKLFVTQSWISVCCKDGFHPMHHHPNSIISGVWYPDIQPGHSPIWFHKVTGTSIALNTNSLNGFNAESYQANISSGDLILFPSTTWHSVPHNNSDSERISLPFNTWTVDDLGTEGSLTHCSINKNNRLGS